MTEEAQAQAQEQTQIQTPPAPVAKKTNPLFKQPVQAVKPNYPNSPSAYGAKKGGTVKAHKSAEHLAGKSRQVH
jgi:hypothetical protein